MTARKAADKKKSQPGQLRIVAGNWRSRLLQIADVPGLRPTSARIRETLFNWLTPGIHGATCLDLCAGTGALGLEALSRGAARAVFVEQSSLAANVLRDNVQTLNATAAEVLNVDARRFLEQADHEQFDLVFLDPPFAADMHGDLCRLLTEQGWLAEQAKIYVEMDKAQSESSLPDSWQILKNKTAGNVRYLLATA
jgi:16S rRNA (guanine966-N2)-methyltransferase